MYVRSDKAEERHPHKNSSQSHLEWLTASAHKSSSQCVSVRTCVRNVNLKKWSYVRTQSSYVAGMVCVMCVCLLGLRKQKMHIYTSALLGDGKISRWRVKSATRLLPTHLSSPPPFSSHTHTLHPFVHPFLQSGACFY